MKIVISSFDNVINLSDEYTQVIEMSDKALFSKISESFYLLCNGEKLQESILLFDKDDTKDFSKHAIFLTSPLLVDIDSKSIQAKLQDAILHLIIHDPERSSEIKKAFFEFVSKLTLFSDEIDLPIDWPSDPDWSKILKCMNPKIDLDNSKNLFERLLLFLEIVSCLRLSSFLILCNFKCFFSDDQLIALYKASRYHAIPLLLIEPSHAENWLDGEHKIWVDEDYVEVLFE